VVKRAVWGLIIFGASASSFALGVMLGSHALFAYNNTRHYSLKGNKSSALPAYRTGDFDAAATASDAAFHKCFSC
jgi:hypothetical protein